MRLTVACLVALLGGVSGCATEEEDPPPPPIEAPEVTAKVEAVVPKGGGRCQITITFSELSAAYGGTVTIGDQRIALMGSSATVQFTTQPLEYGSSYPLALNLTHFTSAPSPIRLQTTITTPTIPFTGPNPAQGSDASRLTFMGAEHVPGTTIQFGVRATPSGEEQFVNASSLKPTADGISIAAPVLLATNPSDPPTFAGAIPPVRVYAKEPTSQGTFSRIYIGDFQYRYRMAQPTLSSGRAGGEISMVLWYPLRSIGVDITLSAKLGDTPLSFIGSVPLIDFTESGVVDLQRVRYQIPSVPPGVYAISISTAFGEDFISSRPVTFEVLP